MLRFHFINLDLMRSSKSPRRSCSHVHHGLSRFLFTNFQGFVFHSERGLKMKRRNTDKFLSCSKMESHRVQSAKTLLMKDSSGRPRRHGVMALPNAF